MDNKMIVLLPMAILHLVGAQQLQLGDNSDRLWFLSIPAFRSMSTPPCSTIESRPAGLRDDYTYTAGVGAHKIHKRPATGWNHARQTCREEGGHLAVINSIVEANVIFNQLKQIGPISGTGTSYAYIGFHDLFEQGDYVTVHDQSLAMAGYTDWASAQPDNGPGGEERCGSVYKDGKLNDIGCNGKRIFICELPIQ